MTVRFAIISGLVVAFAIGGLVLARRQPGFIPPGPMVNSQKFGDYEIKVYARHEESFLERISNKLPHRLSKLSDRLSNAGEWGGLEIIKAGQRIYWQYGSDNLWIAEFGSNTVAGLDITGDRIPKIAITDQLGRQGGGLLMLFACGEKVQQIANIESLGRFPEFKDLDGDGFPELIVSDNAFYHWPRSMDGEPMPEVILRWKNGKYIPATELMFKPSPATNELTTLANKIKTSPEWNAESVPETLWTNAVALIYGGHEDLGWKFVDLAWAPGFPKGGAVSKDDLIGQLKSRLHESLYWSSLHEQIQSNKVIRRFY